MSRFSNGSARSRRDPRCDFAPVSPGSWVAVTPSGHERPSTLAVVDSGPRIIDLENVGLTEGVRLHDGSHRDIADVASFDMAGTIALATVTLASVSRLAPVLEADVLRVHRAACLARAVLSPTPDMVDPITALVGLDDAIAEMERAAKDAVLVRLPNLVQSLYWAGALTLAGSSPGWVPGDPTDPHPRWPAQTGGMDRDDAG